MDHIIAKRESLLSIEATRKSLGISSVNLKPLPKDAFYLCHMLCFSIGFMHLMPIMFLGSAANYWFYKFRNATQENYDPSDRTELQTIYQSASMVAQTIPSLFFIFLTTKYGHKFHPKSMSAATLVCLIGVFSTFTIFTQVDTDTWQTGFFITTMLLLVVNSAVAAAFQLSSIVIIAKFPNDYMTPFLLGQSGSIISNIIQVISISVTDYQPTAAAIYFGVGVLLITTTLVLLLVTKFTEPYKVYIIESDKIGEASAKKITWSECKVVVKDIWPSLVLLVWVLLSICCIHPAISTLVVSEFHYDENVWTEKYFIPVITFLLSDVSGIAGRLVASIGFKITKSNNLYWIIGGGVIRCFVCVTFAMFCNAQPRNLPVIFDHDWEYILFTILFSFSNGLLLTVAILSLNELSPGNNEVSLKLCSIVMAVAATAFCANGIIMVKLLKL